MSIDVYEIPEEQRPPWTIKYFPAGWYECVIDSWRDYKDFIDWLDRTITGDFDVHQAKPFQDWPRVYYVGLQAERDIWSFKLVWINKEEPPTKGML